MIPIGIKEFSMKAVQSWSLVAFSELCNTSACNNCFIMVWFRGAIRISSMGLDFPVLGLFFRVHTK